ncbi:Galactose mutarotase [Chitinophaga costaii]|uniref:Galactose mutarotase n=1 Tax=Chitinophaga costaii TaxID=1335309 RepID=A0A1C4FB53_9BACT|nr:aldose 1-epimerase family protein [Chitinophaga costaii]PUZ20722.1 aldose 1-epimerase family protein [Chitinophaga costaii]SCC53092.1 Galactose mutarotase [Chitinophaga costaii]
MLQISNDRLQVSIAEKGAELQHIVRTDLQQEYLWNADPAFWAKKSPVLFPIVGGLKNNNYTFKEKTYSLGRHGFARDLVFTVTAQAATSITLELGDTADSRSRYPFPFLFAITYTLSGTTLQVKYHVKNPGAEPLYFSVGGHPAFKVPLVPGTTYEDYRLEFNHVENAGRWPLSAEGLVQEAPAPLLENTNTLPLKKELFAEDALVFKHLQSDVVTLKSNATPRGLRFHFAGFPYLGIWAAPNADFVCIEPWCGIADSVNASGDLTRKEGIITLEANGVFERQWEVTLL